MAAKSLPLAVSIVKILTAPFFKKVEGMENLPSNGAFIITPNHSSFMDGIAIVLTFEWSMRRAMHMIAYDEPFRHWLLGWFMRSSRCIPFDRGSHDSRELMMRTALGFLKMSEPVGIFPEGHLNNGKRLRRARPGAAYLALESGVPVVPVGIRGSQKIIPLGSKLPHFKKAVEISVGKPLNFAEESKTYHETNDSHKRTEIVKQVSESIMGSISILSGMQKR